LRKLASSPENIRIFVSRLESPFCWMTYGIGMGTAEPHSARGQAAHEILRLTGAPKWATCDELSTKPNGSRDQAVLQLKEIIAESNLSYRQLFLVTFSSQSPGSSRPIGPSANPLSPSIIPTFPIVFQPVSFSIECEILSLLRVISGDRQRQAEQFGQIVRLPGGTREDRLKTSSRPSGGKPCPAAFESPRNNSRVSG
jgi:hypothetical protein